MTALIQFSSCLWRDEHGGAKFQSALFATIKKCVIFSLSLIIWAREGLGIEAISLRKENLGFFGKVSALHFHKFFLEKLNSFTTMSWFLSTKRIFHCCKNIRKSRNNFEELNYRIRYFPNTNDPNCQLWE